MAERTSKECAVSFVVREQYVMWFDGYYKHTVIKKGSSVVVQSAKQWWPNLQCWESSGLQSPTDIKYDVMKCKCTVMKATRPMYLFLLQQA